MRSIATIAASLLAVRCVLALAGCEDDTTDTDVWCTDADGFVVGELCYQAEPFDYTIDVQTAWIECRVRGDWPNWRMPSSREMRELVEKTDMPAIDGPYWVADEGRQLGIAFDTRTLETYYVEDGMAYLICVMENVE